MHDADPRKTYPGGGVPWRVKWCGLNERDSTAGRVPFVHGYSKGLDGLVTSRWKK
jgi:hypothetical protein